MKHKFLSLLGIFCLLCTSQVWAISEGESWFAVENSPYVYFDNSKTNWTDVSLMLGRKWTHGSNAIGSYGQNMSQIANTKIWIKQSQNEEHMTTLAFFGVKDWKWKDNETVSHRAGYTNDKYTNSYNEGLNGGSYLYVPANGSKDASLTRSNDSKCENLLQRKQTVVVLLSTDDGAHYYESNIWYGTIEAERYLMDGVDKVKSDTKTLAKDNNQASAVLTSSVTFKESGTTDGFTFQGWKTSEDGEIQSGDLTYTVDGEKTIYACFTGPDADLPKVYFVNTANWPAVWVHFYASEYWDKDKGTGTKGIYHSCIPMTKMDDSNIWYFAYPFDKKSDYIAFTSEEQKGYEFFYGCSAAYRGDFNSSQPVFVPCPGISATLNTSTNYYSKGYWKTLEEHYQYYLKNTWGGTTDNDWSWKKMETTDGVTYTLSNVGYSFGFGYNYNFLDEEVGKSTYITDYTKVGVLETGDKVNIEFTPANGKIKVTLIPTNLNVTIGSTGYATYYYSKPYIVPADVQVQYITGVDDRALTNAFLKEGDIIPANEGVILHGEQGDYIFGGTTEVPEKLADNMLTGTLTATEINNGLVHYIMTLNDQSKVGLFWPYGTTEGVGGFTNGAHKAYLEIPAGSSAPRRIGYAFDEVQTPTGVVDVNENVNANRKVMINNQLIIIRNGVRYNANGQMIKINGTW